MKAASLSEIKKELTTLSPARVLELAMRVAKYKKDNKELLTYLLFEADDEEAYKRSIKGEIVMQFAEMNRSNMHLAKKSIRKILRMANKYIRYSGSPTTTADILLFFCRTLKDSGVPIHKSTAMVNLFEAQLKKIEKTIAGMHEDLQYDYLKEVAELR